MCNYDSLFVTKKTCLMRNIINNNSPFQKYGCFSWKREIFDKTFLSFYLFCWHILVNLIEFYATVIQVQNLASYKQGLIPHFYVKICLIMSGMWQLWFYSYLYDVYELLRKVFPSWIFLGVLYFFIIFELLITTKFVLLKKRENLISHINKRKPLNNRFLFSRISFV